MKGQLRYFAIYKPYGMLSQFSGDQLTLKHLTFPFPKDIYPIGRLDKDSEGLLLLTNDKSIISKILDPKSACKKTYLAQVDGQINIDQLNKLMKGVEIKINNKLYKTMPCKATTIMTPDLPECIPPIRYRKNIPTSWCKIVIQEGKNRQIRKMCAAVDAPVLRLVRSHIGRLSIEGMSVGEVKEISKNEIIRYVFR